MRRFYCCLLVFLLIAVLLPGCKDVKSKKTDEASTQTSEASTQTSEASTQTSTEKVFTLKDFEWIIIGETTYPEVGLKIYPVSLPCFAWGTIADYPAADGNVIRVVFDFENRVTDYYLYDVVKECRISE